jgi:hypothetical protein
LITKKRVMGAMALVVAVSVFGPASAEARTGAAGPVVTATGGRSVSLQASSPGPDMSPALHPAALPGDTCTQVRADHARLAREGKRQVWCSEGTTTAATAKAKPATPTMTALATVTASSAPSWCPTGSWAGYRDQMCVTWTSHDTAYDVQTNKTIGGIDFTVSQYVHLNYKSATVTEDFEVRFFNGWGPIQGLTMSIATWCPAPCSASGGLTRVTAANGVTQYGTAAYTVAPAGTVTTNVSYGFQFFGTAGAGNMVTWVGPNFRCDNQLPGNIGAGCVVPWYTPTMTSMASLPYISAGIRAIQNAGGYGKQGGIPLERTVDPNVNALNYRTACAGKTPPPGTNPLLTSCHEYPFKSTYQGAAEVPPPGSGITWVPVDEQNSQGSAISTFYMENRLLDQDPFWVWV